MLDKFLGVGRMKNKEGKCRVRKNKTEEKFFEVVPICFLA
jgi:hypothetical protein